MIYFQQFLTAISLLQVPNVFVNLSGDIDAEKALHTLTLHMELLNDVISSDIPDDWNKYVKMVEEEKQENLNYLLGNFSSLISNITEFGTGVAGAEACTIEFRQSPFVRKDTIKYTDSAPGDIFINLQRLAKTELSRSDKQRNYLYAEYYASCGETKINCEGTSRTIVAEARRLAQRIDAVFLDIMVETILLAYDTGVDSWSLHAYIVSQLDAAVQNITACIASKIQESTLEPSNKIVKQSNRVGSILDSYSDLVNVSEDALLKSQKILLSYETSVANQSAEDYRVTITVIRNVGDQANQTIDFLREFMEGLGLTQICALPDVRPVINSSLSRSLKEYTDIGIHSVGFVVSQGLSNINVIMEEITSIALQTDGCSSSTTCDYLEEKIDRKMTGIPLTMRSVANSAAVLMHKSVSSVQKSRLNVVRDILEQLRSGIVNLMYCIKTKYHE